MATTDRGGLFRDWDEEDAYWQSHDASRPYGASTAYEWRPADGLGHDSAPRYQVYQWSDAADTRSTWQRMKDAARNAWDRVTGNR